MRRMAKAKWFVAFTLAIGGLVWALVVPMQRSLLAHASRIPGTENSWNYLWKSPNELIFFPFQGAITASPGLTEISLCNLQTGKHTPLPTLTKQFVPNLNKFPVEYSLSPDGKWILFAQQGQFTATTLDGTKQRHWATKGLITGTPSIVWLPNSHQWVEWTFYNIATNPRWIQHVSKPILHNLDASQEKGIPLTIPSPKGTFLGKLNTGSALSTDFGHWGNWDKQIALLTFDLKSSNVPVQKRVIPIPRGNRVWDMQLSPKGDHLLWAMDHESESPIARLRGVLHLRQRQQSQSHRYMSLWVSSWDGSNLHELGQYEDQANALEVPNWFHWTPDGKSISFSYQGSLWTVPAD